MTIEHDAAREAVMTLGLLTPDAIPTIARLINANFNEHPRAVATRYRKEGDQIDDAAKKTLGIRKNGFLSKASYSEITNLGLASPLTAHETTLLRATFTVARHNRVAQGEATREHLGTKFAGYLHETLHRECSACNELNGAITDAAGAAIMPPATCVPGCFANYDIRAKIDWLADID
ncbi:hypothetical protein NHF48_019770 [Sphingomonas sp. H160509]|uniref:hypothetical protein n=1 Tax=Sphingomonas sp. H160509 TaxID=2955313 RepID=UPI0020980779|nr:hypothetical protein [Sphingomonas sp. H160509]MDD1452657.1 hypothetical protein [Sphingomonas sp. H160509]